MRRRLLFGIAGVAVLVGALIAAEAIRLLGAYRDLSRARDTVLAVQQTLLNGETLVRLSAADVARTQAQLADAQRRLHSAAGVVGGDPLLALGTHLPLLGRQAAAARTLAAIGADLGDAGVDAGAVLGSLQQARDDAGTPALEKVAPTLTAMQPSVDGIDQHLQDVRRLRGRIPPGRLLGPLGGALSTLDRQLPRAEAAVAAYHEALAAAPVALGYASPRTYLVLARDSSELVGSGGFDLAYGLITLDHGKLTQVSFKDANDVHAGPWPPPDPQNYLAPPAPVAKYLLGTWPMTLPDVSWYLDFPTSAQQAIQVYHVNSGDQTPIAGVVALDSYALEDLLRLTGPVTVPQFQLTVTADDIIRQQLVIGNPPADAPPRPDGLNPRQFKVQLANQLFTQLQQLPASRWPQLATTVQSQVRHRYTAVYDTDPALEQEYDRLDVAGRIPAASGEDFLMVADASVGHSKLNLVVQRALALDVSLDAAGNASERLTLTYSVPFKAWQEKDPQLAAVFESPSKHFGDYLRVLTPSDTALVSFTLNGRPLAQQEPVTTEAGHREFAAVVSMGEDSTLTLGLASQVPHAASGDGATLSYELRLLKQPGTKGGPATIAVHPPAGWVVQSAQLDGQAVAAPAGQVQTDLTQDRLVRVLLRRAGT